MIIRKRETFPPVTIRGPGCRDPAVQGVAITAQR
jgi:hypothetical protein